jgi:hypothetical protein
MSISLLRRLLMKEAVKDTAGSSGIMSINKNIADKVEQQLQKYINDAMQQGVDLDTLSPEQLKMIVQMNKPKPPRVIAADSPEGRQITEQLFGKRGEVVDMTGKKLDTSQGIMGGKSVKELMDSGQVTKGTVTKKSKKVTDREMFKAANERLTSDVDSIIKNIKSMEPITAMKEANSVIARKGKYKNLTPEQSKKILQDTEDHIFERNVPEDPEDFAQGGIARANFVGGGMGRRGFLKMLAGLGGGIAAAKTGLLKLAGKEPVKQVAKEVVQSTGSGRPPPYFFKLAEKIKFMGDDAVASQDKAIAKKYKDYVLEEDFAGNIEIKKTNYGMFGDEIAPTEEVYMSYKVDDVPVKGKKGSTKVEEYEEYTVRPDGDGKMKDVEDGVPEDVLDDAGDPDSMTLKKAGGGIARLGYQMGGDVAYDATDSIYGSSAITVTPDTVMGPGGNQIQDKMGKPGLSSLIPPGGAKKIGGPYIPPQGPPTSVTEGGVGQDSAREAYAKAQQDAKKQRAEGFMGRVVLPGEMSFENFSGMYNSKLSGPQELPSSGGGLGGLPELDLPNLGGNNNQMGILPVMPPKSEYYTGKNYGPGNQAYAAVMPQPGMRYVYDEKGTRYSVPIEDYEGPTSGTPLAQELKSQQLAANYGDSPLASTVRTNMLSGGIARMLGE